MADTILTTLTVGLLQGISLLYGILAYIPVYFIDQPSARLKASRQVKARPVSLAPGAAYRSVDSFQSLSRSPFAECHTLDDLFTRAVRLHGHTERCLGTRELIDEQDEVQPNGKVFKKVILGEYKWLSLKQVNSHVRHFGSGLHALGQRAKYNIAIFAETRAEWMIAVQACFQHNFPVVTLYATLGDDAVVHGLNESEVDILITSPELLPKLKNLLNDTPAVKHVICMNYDGKPLPRKDEFPPHVTLHSQTSVEQLGTDPQYLDAAIQKPTPSDLAVIMYTSGSTGMPKGVLITHANLMCGMSGQIPSIPNLCYSDVYIAYLPLAHVLELTCELSVFAYGVPIGYASALTLSDQSSKIKRGSKGDATELRPTLMACVPLVMDRLYKTIWAKVKEGGELKRALFTFAYKYKKAQLLNGHTTPILDRLVFQKIRDILGGRIRLMLSGGAPLSDDTQRFMNICFCCHVGQGYGLTETCGATTVQSFTDLSAGRVGAPLSCNDVKLVDWKEGGYTQLDKPFPRGEIWVGGGNVTMGYYKNTEKTHEEFFVEDGVRWFSTGDIGQWEEGGILRIIDRKKDLVKLQAGEYVALSKVEMVLKMSPLVDNILVYGDSTKLFTVSLVVPSASQLRKLAATLGVPPAAGWAEICTNPAVEKAVLQELQALARKGKLQGFEIPMRVTICPDFWTPDMGLVTAAFKLRRTQIHSHYATDITRMYA